RTCERLCDDFAWENDRIAFRMYGPACGKTENVLSGIDIWSKKVDESIIDLWYQRNEAGLDYHTDRGEGADFYKVGATLGAGGLGFIADDKLVCAKYWSKSRILEQGSERIVFELDFEPLKVGAATVTETKRITLKRGSNLNLIECTFKIVGADRVKVAAGIRRSHHAGDQLVKLDGVVTYREMAAGKQETFSAIALAGGEYLEKFDHHLLTTEVKNGQTLSYCAGAAWLGSGQFADFTAWQNYVAESCGN
ncbi:MAG: DUF4861 family protein, partial [Lentisphaeraceae bacterium]|nr:DUF4861 family protein [Lentisphaeraceae bacterium]